MLQQELYDRYGLYASHLSGTNTYRHFVTRSGQYFLIPADDRTEEDLVAFIPLLNCLVRRGVSSLLFPIPSRYGKYVESFFGESFVVLQLVQRPRHRLTLLEELAVFHDGARSCVGEQVDTFSYVPWNDRWAERTDRLEAMLAEQRLSTFQTLEETFPYFTGLAENAIQYVVDTQLDEGRIEPSELTVTHTRFTESTWVSFKSERLKLPTSWVFDHPVRDLAEWCRPMLMVERGASIAYNGLRQYLTKKRLTRKAWRLFYGRLLYPLTYSDLLERYIKGEQNRERQMNEQALQDLIERVPLYERNIAMLYQFLRKQAAIPAVEWLVNRQH